MTRLSKVVTNVVNEVKSGFTLNCTASSVVFAAIGIAAKKNINIFNHIIIMKLTSTTAKSGDIIILKKVTVFTYFNSNFCGLISASCMPRISMTVGIEADPTKLIPS